MLSLTCLIMPTDKGITQTIFMVLFTSRSLSHLGETPGHLIRCLPQVLVCHQLSTNCILSLQIQHYALFSQGSKLWGKDLGSLWGYLNICPLLQQFHITSLTQSELFSLTSIKAWGDMEKFHNDIAFLLVSAKEEAIGNRTYDLSTVWVNPYQVRVPTVEEAVRELTTLVSSGPNWPHTLVWLNEDTCHAPLPRERHLGVLPEGGTDSTTHGRISQLEVCQLLIFGQQVIYQVGLNGHKVPLITSLPESLANGTSLTGGKSVYLKVDILQSIVKESDQKASPPGGCPSILMASPVKATSPKPEREVRMTMEVRDLLSQVMLDKSGHVSGNSTPKRPNPMVILTPPPHKLRDLSGPVDTSSQVSTPEDTEMA